MYEEKFEGPGNHLQTTLRRVTSLAGLWRKGLEATQFHSLWRVKVWMESRRSTSWVDWLKEQPTRQDLGRGNYLVLDPFVEISLTRIPASKNCSTASTEKIIDRKVQIFLKSFFFFFWDFLMWTIFKVFIEFFTTLLLSYVLDFWPWGMWDLTSLTRNQTHTLCTGDEAVNTGPSEKSLCLVCCSK